MNKQLFKFFQKTRFGLLSALLAATLLSIACGGGGGGGGDVASGTGQVDGNGNPVVPGGTTPPVNAGLLDPSIVSRPGEGGNDQPSVAIDAVGNAISIWRRQVSSLPTYYELLARRYVVGSGWQPIEVLAADDPSNVVREIQTPIQLAMNPATGVAMAIWVEQRETGNAAGLRTSEVKARTYNPASGWGPTATIDSDAPMINFNVALALDANGNAMAVWSRYEALQSPVYASRFTTNGGWSAPTRIEDSTGIGDGGNGMLVTFLPNGNALVVWNSSRGGTTSNIWGNQYTVGSGWGKNALVMSGSGAQTSGLIRLLGGVRGLAADQNGNAVLTFENQQLFLNPSRYELNLWSKRYSGGAWGADSTAVPVGVPLSCVSCPSVYGGSVQMNAQGAAVATWELRNASGDSVIWAARNRSDGTWESQQLSTNLPGFRPSNEFPQAGIDDQGNVNVLWAYTNTETNIYSARYTANSGWAAPVLAEDYSGNAERPRIAMNARGNAMTVWLQFENAVGSVIAGRYYNSGR